MEPEVQRHLPLNPRDYLILLTLVPGERHGYGMIQMVEEETAGGVKLDPANLYRALKRLIKVGLVQEAGRRPAPDAQDERRRYYAITETGRRVVAEEAMRQAELLEFARNHDLLADTGGSS
jgi:DNA-binding PadR family transcriptional regulator